MHVKMKCSFHTVSDLKAVGIFFKHSPKRQRRIEEEEVKEVNARRSDEGHPPLSSFKAKLMYETGWVEQHTVLAESAEMYEPTAVCLEAIGSNSDGSYLELQKLDRCKWTSKIHVL